VLVEIAAADGVTVETVGREDPRLGRTGDFTDRVAQNAYASFATATVVSVPMEAVITEPTVLTLRGEGAEGAAYGHIVIELAPFASATVVLDHRGSATYAGNVEVLVGDSAALTLVSIQDWDDDAVHLGHQRIELGRDARIRMVTVTFGGNLVRLFPQVNYKAPGGDAELLGLYFADDGQHLEHRSAVCHTVPNCRSNVAYKGALQGKSAHTVWIGDVMIRPEATGTDTYEINRNLLLTDGARADSVPNLEILTGEITGAGHASATGRFDDEQLFYLQARGIPAVEARRLVVRGFFAEIIQQIGIPDLQERLSDAIEEELARTLS
jgi:Fe-S cluster assembly protein SufD